MITDDDVVRIINSLLRRSLPAVSGDERLSALGVDSLTTINVIVAAAEEFGLALEALTETAAAPVTVTDLTSLLRGIGAPRQGAV
jgi:acyl carrier protein